MNLGLLSGSVKLAGGNDGFDGRACGQGMTFGGDGNDQITGEVNAQTIDGGIGNDLRLANGGDDGVHGGADNDLVTGTADEDNLTGDDQRFDGIGADPLQGQAGGGTLTGGVGNQSLQGVDGEDRVYGQAGVAIRTGGRGNDTLTGGTEAVTFAMTGNGGEDQVTDFQDGIDMLDLQERGDQPIRQQGYRLT